MMSSKINTYMRKDIKTRHLFILFSSFVYLFASKLIFAASPGPCPPGTLPGTICIPNPLRSGTNTLYDFIKTIINDVILPVGGVIAVIYIIYAGFLLVTARGDEKKLSDGKRAFFYAAIGTLILLGAWAIAQAIEGTINQLISP
jgi:type IV secretory pathway VirB2 component (pilin)